LKISMSNSSEERAAKRRSQFDRPPAVADDRQVVGHPDEDPPAEPERVVAPLPVFRVLDVAIGRHDAGFVRLLDLPRAAVGQPVVGLLALAAVVDHLPEEAILVVDAVAEAGMSRLASESRKQAASRPRPPCRAPRHARCEHLLEVAAELFQSLPRLGEEPQVCRLFSSERPTRNSIDR